MPPSTFITPPDIPSELDCVTLQIPADKLWAGNLLNALLMLSQEWRWEQVSETDLTPAVTAEAWRAIVWQWLDQPLPCPNISPTPFWDDGGDVDDSFPWSTQPWYGSVTDPDAPADEITFVENAAIWIISGFVAYAGGIGAAVVYHTIAPRFVLAWKRGDIGEIWRVIVDAAEYQVVDTSSASVGDIVTLDVLPDQEISGHDLTLIKMGETS